MCELLQESIGCVRFEDTVVKDRMVSHRFAASLLSCGRGDVR